jgi:hypothetical protein
MQAEKNNKNLDTHIILHFITTTGPIVSIFFPPVFFRPICRQRLHARAILPEIKNEILSRWTIPPTLGVGCIIHK